MPNVPLAIVSVYQHMSNFFHTLAYACAIRNSVTGPLKGVVCFAYSSDSNSLGEWS